MGISNLTEKHLKSAKQSAVSDHLLECSLDFDNFDILSSDTNKFMLLLNIETDNKHIGIEQYQFSNTFISFTCNNFQYFWWYSFGKSETSKF